MTSATWGLSPGSSAPVEVFARGAPGGVAEPSTTWFGGRAAHKETHRNMQVPLLTVNLVSHDHAVPTPAGGARGTQTDHDTLKALPAVAVAWCYSNSGDWIRRIDAIVDSRITRL